MHNLSKNQLTTLVFHATETRKIQHLYLRGNFQQDMFYDFHDKTNVWNRLWLAAAATETQILSATILNNHLHLTVLLKREKQESDFMHYFRLSITQYHNRKYQVRGVLGTRDFKRGCPKDTDDVRDCISYHIRNVLHHSVLSDFMSYEFSTARSVFGLESDAELPCYTSETLPHGLARSTLPARVILPKGWSMTRSGMIIPPPEVFRADIVEALFGTREEYLETLTRRTDRESAGSDEPQLVFTRLSRAKIQLPDERVSEYVKENCRIPIPSMTDGQKMEAVRRVMEEFPKVHVKLLARLFAIPYTTLRYRLKNLYLRD